MEGQRYNLKYKMTNHVYEFQNTHLFLHEFELNGEKSRRAPGIRYFEKFEK